MLEKEISLLFKEIGIDENIANLYIYILTNSPVSDSEIKKGFKNRKIDSHIQQLSSIPLISFDLDKNMQTIYYAIKPSTAFKAISDQELWHRYPSTKSLVTLQDEEISRFILNFKKIGENLDPLYKRRSSIGINSLRIARDENQLSTFLCETISLANSEILAVSSPPLLPKIALIWNELCKKIKLGVEYKRIIDLWEMSYHGYEVKRRDVEETGVKLRIIKKSKLDRKFYVVDDSHVVLFRPDLLRSKGFSLEGQVIKNKALSKKFKEYFNKLWKEAIPAEDVLKHMSEIRNKLLQSAMEVLDDVGIAWFKTLIDFGNFAEWPNLFQTKKDIIKELALENGLVVQSSDFKMGVVPNYNWSFDITKKYLERTKNAK